MAVKKIQKNCHKIKNPFWKEVLDAFWRFSQGYTPDTPYILTEDLYFNSYAKFKCTVVRDWDKRGLRFLGDLVDESTGQIMTREALQTKFGVSLTFLCYSSLLKSLPVCVKQQKQCAISKPIIPLRMNLVMNHSNFPRFAYDTFVDCKKSEFAQTNERQRQKWIRDIECFVDNSLVEVTIATSSTSIRMFHYRLINRILATNRFLKMINIKDDDRCTFCSHETETLAHMFWYCDNVQLFLQQVISNLRTEYHFELEIDPKSWFFLTDLSPIETLIVTLAKIVIYRARLDDRVPNARHLKNKLKREAEVEYTAARISCNLKKFETKWGSLKRILQSP